MSETTADTGWVEIDAELIEAIDTRAQQHGVSFETALQKCLVTGVNHAMLNSFEKIS